MTAINQLQMSYSPEEDRVLLRLNTTSAEEFRFWLTRRYCQLMVQALNAHRAADPDVSNQVSPVSRKLVEAFKYEADDLSENFKDDLKASVKSHLGEVPTLAPWASLTASCRKLAPPIFRWVRAGVTVTLDTP